MHIESAIIYFDGSSIGDAEMNKKKTYHKMYKNVMQLLFFGTLLFMFTGIKANRLDEMISEN